jgi:hypothetical protein
LLISLADGRSLRWKVTINKIHQVVWRAGGCRYFPMRLRTKPLIDDKIAASPELREFINLGVSNGDTACVCSLHPLFSRSSLAETSNFIQFLRSASGIPLCSAQ